MEDYLLEKTEDGVLVFTINREEKRNAVNYEVMDGLQKAIDEASSDDEIKLLIIKAAGGKAFCSGGDLETFHGLKTEEQAYSMLKKMGDILYQLATLPKITAALIDGSAVGGGCEIAAACDFRAARKGVKLGFIQGRLAITTGWGGGSLLMEKMTPGHALYLLGTADLYSSEHMHEYGFINYLLEKADVPSLVQCMKGFLNKDVNVLVAYKQAVKEKWESVNLYERIDKEIRTCAGLWEKEAHHQAVEKFLYKK
ncbi:enoyl-CoA hydratase/isomerase family protein [Bacillus sp. P14.5]|uniref:enoyl-CoA hydratase/isomerase family protein n=1 Tax=Bacillus sp. P14.5 TaxID=1983400 RepID=UPI000DEB8ADB|nr:enoyl-CoA hydratase/isomerase family protein [Bacillus sp. P14.5]